jgi:Chaperone of endosialidase
MNGRLGTATSSKRFKEGIRPMDDRSETLFFLKPVTFRYKKGIDPEGLAGRSQFGLVAGDVEKVNPDLIVRDKEGKPYSVRYDQANAMLLNEFLKAHRRMEEQDKRIDELTEQLKQQAAQIRRMSAQLELSKTAPQTVKNTD